MILRLLLVGVVSGLGIQPPPADDVRSWVDSGREWWVARAAEWNDAFVAAINSVEADGQAEDETESTVVDLPTVEDFLADVPAPVVEQPAPAPAPEPAEAEAAAAVEPAPAEPEAEALPVAEVEADMDALFDRAQDEMIAEFLADPMVGQPGVAAEPTTLAQDDSAASEGDDCVTDLTDVEPTVVPAAVVAADEPPAPNHRLARALKLTGDAFHAWADLLQGKRDQPIYQ